MKRIFVSRNKLTKIRITLYLTAGLFLFLMFVVSSPVQPTKEQITLIGAGLIIGWPIVLVLVCAKIIFGLFGF